MKTLEEDINIEIVEPNNKHSFASVLSCGLNGVNAYPVEIEIDISGGLPNFILVGLPDAAINESKERVRAAIKSSNLEFPSKKIVVNLAPADTKKAGPTYDLAIALGILTCNEVIDSNNLNDIWVVGELGLSGKIRQVNGVLSFVISAKNNGAKGIIIPKENKEEAALIKGINIYPVDSLSEAIKTIKNIKSIKPFTSLNLEREIKKEINQVDFSEVKGQLLAKRALEIAAAGGHHVLMIGSPGSGKSMLAQRLSTIMPPLFHEERIEVTQIYSAGGKLNSNRKIIIDRPFRTPHHSASAAGLIGGGSIPQPGEISLAHKGVLFLDELIEFQKKVLDSLRQAIETKEITLSRARKSSTFPCDFILIAACNPCPCGYYGDSLKKCTCSTFEVRKYLNKISGPILDRIDLQVEVKRLNENELISNQVSESSPSIKSRVIAGREVQKKRYKDQTINLNSEIGSRSIREHCKLSTNGQEILKEAIKSLALSARSYDRLLKVSRTIADLSNSDIIKDEHILEALQFRLSTFKA